MHWRAVGDRLAHIAAILASPGSVIISAILASLKTFPTSASDSTTYVSLGELAVVFADPLPVGNRIRIPANVEGTVPRAQLDPKYRLGARRGQPQSEDCLTTEQIQALLEDSVSPQESALAEDHLSICARCRTQLEAEFGVPEWWSAAKESLSESSPNESPKYVDNPYHTDWQQLLGPTDDPSKLGRIGNYEVVGLLGRGGMGIVFKAFDGALNRYVAIKMLAPHLATSGAARKRFARERACIVSTDGKLRFDLPKEAPKQSKEQSPDNFYTDYVKNTEPHSPSRRKAPTKAYCNAHQSNECAICRTARKYVNYVGKLLVMDSSHHVEHDSACLFYKSTGNMKYWILVSRNKLCTPPAVRETSAFVGSPREEGPAEYFYLATVWHCTNDISPAGNFQSSCSISTRTFAKYFDSRIERPATYFVTDGPALRGGRSC